MTSNKKHEKRKQMNTVTRKKTSYTMTLKSIVIQWRTVTNKNYIHTFALSTQVKSSRYSAFHPRWIIRPNPEKKSSIYFEHLCNRLLRSDTTRARWIFSSSSPHLSVGLTPQQQLARQLILEILFWAFW